MARAIWFGSDLSIRIDRLRVNSIKDRIKDWLSKPELHQPEALWFYDQFVCSLWCIWIHMNYVIFNYQKPDPSKVLFHQIQKVLLQWIAYANQEKTRIQFNKQRMHSHQSHLQNQVQRQPCPSTGPVETHNVGSWRLFIKVRKIRGMNWYGTSSLIRSPTRFSIVCCKSLTAPDKRPARVIILGEALLRVREFDVKSIMS